MRFFSFLILGYVTMAFFRSSVGVLLPSIAHEFSLVELQSGAFAAALFVGMIATAGFAGYVSDRVGRTIASTAGLFLMSTGFLLTGFSSSYLFALTSTFISGLGAGVVVPSVYAALGESLPESRGLLTGFANGCYAFGGFVGPWFTGIVLSSYGWRLPLYIFGLVGIPMGLGVWFSGLRTLPKSKTGHTVRQRTSAMLKSQGVLVSSAALLSGVIGFSCFLSWAPTFLITVDGLNIAQAGFVVGIWGLTGGAGSMVLGWLSDRWNRKAVNFVSGIGAAILAYLYFASVNPFLVIAVVSAVFGLTGYAYYSLIISLAQDSVDSAAIGSVTGFVQNASIAGAIVAPVLAALLISFIGMKWGMIVSVCIPYAVQAVVMLAPSSKTHRQ